MEAIINISPDVSCISIYVSMQEWINILGKNYRERNKEN
jgi:hypothetical protein